MSLAGSVIGVALADTLCALASARPGRIDVDVPTCAVLLEVGIAASTGIFFGLPCALEVARLNPIDALRGE